jgi:hypothetical protein
MEYTIDTAIITVIISASVAFGIFGLKEKWIEPRRWKKTIKKEIVKEQLEVFGTLTTLLQTFEKKAEDDQICKTNNFTHHLDSPLDDNKLNEIFEKSRYLLSKELAKEYLKFVKEKKTYNSYKGDEKIGSNTYCNLIEMQKIAENEYVKVKTEYEKITSYKLNPES